MYEKVIDNYSLKKYTPMMVYEIENNSVFSRYVE